MSATCLLLIANVFTEKTTYFLKLDVSENQHVCVSRHVDFNEHI